MTDGDAGAVADAAAGARDLLLGLFGEAHPGTVFSAPAEVADGVVVTAAAWERAGGFGFGGGGGGDAVESGFGSGAGGGGVSQGRPVAVIHVGASGIRVVPVLDFTKIGITLALAALGVWRALSR